MIKKLIMVLSVLVLIVLVGCATSSVKPTSGEVYTPKATQIPQTEVSGIESRLSDKVWISPAEVQVGNFHSGARAEWNIRIHNGSDTLNRFSVTYRIPDKTREGYTMPPRQAQDWVIIADSTPLFTPNETREILVVLALPEGIDKETVGDRWEFWVSVIKQGQGNLQTEMCERWLISMR